MVDRIRDLLRDELEKLQVGGIRSAVLHAANVKRADTGLAHQQRQIDHPPQPFPHVIIILEKQPLPLQIWAHVNRPIVIHPTDRASRFWNDGIAMQISVRHAGFHGVKPERIRLGIVERHPGAFPLHDLANLLRDRPPQTIGIALRIEDVGHRQQRAVTAFDITHQ